MKKHRRRGICLAMLLIFAMGGSFTQRTGHQQEPENRNYRGEHYSRNCFNRNHIVAADT